MQIHLAMLVRGSLVYGLLVIVIILAIYILAIYAYRKLQFLSIATIIIPKKDSCDFS